MPRRPYWIGDHPHTLDMARANQRCWREHRRSLREYLLRWREQHPTESLEELAAEFGVCLKTLHNWLNQLRLGRGGPVIFDLETTRPNVDASSALATGTEG